MSGPTLFVAFLGIFGAVFGAMLLGMRYMTARQVAAAGEAALELEGGRPARRGADEPAVSPKDQALADRLRLAGIGLDAATYKQRVLRGAIVASIVGWFMGGMGAGGVLFGCLCFFFGWKAGDWYLNYKQTSRMNEFLDQFTDALGVMANGVKSGQTVLQTLEVISQDFNDPIRSEVEEVLQELRMGVPMDESLAAWAARMPMEDLEIATTALIVQRQTGGNVAEILDTVATTIRERNKLYKQIRTLTTQGRMSGVVLSLLPVGLFLAMFLIAPERTGLLLSHPIGLLLTALGVGGIALGAYFIKRIVTIEV